MISSVRRRLSSDDSKQRRAQEEALAEIVGRTAAQHLLDRFGSLNQLAGASTVQLCAVPSMDAAKASSLRSAFSLAVLLLREESPTPLAITGPSDLANLLREDFRGLQWEELRMVMIDSNRHYIADVLLAKGSADTIAGIGSREIFYAAAEYRAPAIALAHNHPSGNLTPSPDDLKQNKQLIEAGQVLEIQVLDHIIFGQKRKGQKDFVSLFELGHIPPNPFHSPS